MNDVARARGEGPVGRAHGPRGHRGRSAGRLGNPRLRAAIRRSVAERAARLRTGSGRCIAAIGQRAIRTHFMGARRLHRRLLRRGCGATLRRRRGGAHVLRLGMSRDAAARARCCCPAGAECSGRAGRSDLLPSLLFFLVSTGLVSCACSEHRGDGQQAAEDSVSGNCSRYIHEIRPLPNKGRTFHTHRSTIPWRLSVRWSSWR